MTQSQAFRITAEAANEPGRQWLRLQLDERDVSTASIDQMVANQRSPVAIVDPANICNIPERGQPARAWIEELEKRDSLFGYELWGLTGWIDIEYARACASGSLWCRTIVDRAALDPITGYPIGTKLMRVELCASPFPQTLTRGNQASDCIERKKIETMSTANTTTLLAALPRFRSDSPNDVIALERAARELLPEAKNMAHGTLYETIVHPALVELGADRMRAAARAGTPMRASSAGAATTQKPVLSVAKYEGPNKFVKLMAHVRSMHPDWNHDRVHQAASEIATTHQIEG